MDYDVVKKIYEFLGGTCENYFNATHPDRYSLSNRKLKRYCTIPCQKSDSDNPRLAKYGLTDRWNPVIHNTSATDWYFDVIALPWTDDTWIPLWPQTHYFRVKIPGPWDASLLVFNSTCLGPFQPHPEADTSKEWIYGTSVFRNAAFIFDTVGNGTIAATARRF